MFGSQQCVQDDALLRATLLAPQGIRIFMRIAPPPGCCQSPRWRLERRVTGSRRTENWCAPERHERSGATEFSCARQQTGLQ